MAGGEGTRAGGEMPKQFVKLLGIPMLWWSVRSFYAEDPEVRITIVIHPGYLEMWEQLYSELPAVDRKIKAEVVCGGRSRTHSVKNGLMSQSADSGTLIAVHDAARPLVTPEMLRRCWATAERDGAEVPCVAEVNSLRVKKGDDAGDTEPVDRSRYLVVQTPQIFRADILQGCYAAIDEKASFTDDASLVQRAGYKVSVCEGLPENLKVTTPMDFVIAEALLKSR